MPQATPHLYAGQADFARAVCELFLHAKPYSQQVRRIYLGNMIDWQTVRGEASQSHPITRILHCSNIIG